MDTFKMVNTNVVLNFRFQKLVILMTICSLTNAHPGFAAPDDLPAEDKVPTSHSLKERPIPVPVYERIPVDIPSPIPVPTANYVNVPIPQPYPVHITVDQPIEVPVYKIKHEIIEKRVPYVVEEAVPIEVKKPYPVEVIKHIEIPVPQPYVVTYPVYKHVYENESYGGLHRRQRYHRH